MSGRSIPVILGAEIAVNWGQCPLFDPHGHPWNHRGACGCVIYQMMYYNECLLWLKF